MVPTGGGGGSVSMMHGLTTECMTVCMYSD